MSVKAFVEIVKKIARFYISTHKKNNKYLNVESNFSDF
jgi:hypothetical protein